MYLKHFHLQKFPFSLTPNTSFYCNLSSHQDVLETLLIGLANGEGFIKIVGEVGTGKTLLCRKLLNSLDDSYVTAYIPNPDLTPDGLRRALAEELSIAIPSGIDQHGLLELINHRLLQLHRDGKNVVLIFDEAQALSHESLEALRLLTNLETESEKLIQVVLFGQPELDDRINQNNLRQLKQRIIFSQQLQPISQHEIEAYLTHRLTTAGYNQGKLFTDKACELLFKESQGLPRVINVLAHKAMMVGYGWGHQQIGKDAVQQAIHDNYDRVPNKSWKKGRWFASFITLMVAVAVTLKFHLITNLQ